MNYDQLMDWGRRNGAGTQVLMARRLNTTQVTISRWRREGVPRYRQYELHVLSGGELPITEEKEHEQQETRTTETEGA